MTPLALDRTDVANYVITLTYVYFALIFVAILMSFLPRVPYNRYLDMFLTFVRDVTGPYLDFFRRLLPMLRVGPFDLTPMIAILALLFVGRLTAALIVSV